MARVLTNKKTPKDWILNVLLAFIAVFTVVVGYYLACYILETICGFRLGL